MSHGLTRATAWELLTEYTKERQPAEARAGGRGRGARLCASASARTKRSGAIVGLLHDFDYERWPSLEDHPFRGSEILREKGYPEWVIRAILSHADYSGVPRESRLEKTLFACDEMAGFITAASLVRPEQERARPRSVVGHEADEGQGVRQGVKRDDLRAGAELLGLPLDQHITQRHRLHARAGGRPRAARHRCEAGPFEPCVAVYQHRMADRDPGRDARRRHRRVRRQPALQDVTASFAAGAVGLLGPNGAGKSTMIKALLGFIVPDRGPHARARARRRRRRRSRSAARVGYMPENDAHIPGMNAVSFVAYCGELSGCRRADAMQRAHEVLFYVGLGEARYRNVETYSTGMKQRIKLAQALVHDPDLLFLDEPTNGMDPEGPRRDARPGVAISRTTRAST